MKRTSFVQWTGFALGTSNWSVYTVERRWEVQLSQGGETDQSHCKRNKPPHTLTATHNVSIQL